MKKLIKTILIIFAAIFGIWVGGLLAFYFEIPTKPNKSTERTDAIIVLTGGENRIAEGLKLFAEKRADKILISGVGKDVAALDIINRGQDKVDLEKIDLGYEAQNTPQNALEAKAWVQENKIKSVRLVTANYHMPRAVKLFKAVMPDLQIVEHPVFPTDFQKEIWFSDKTTARLIFWEYNKYLASL